MLTQDSALSYSFDKLFHYAIAYDSNLAKGCYRAVFVSWSMFSSCDIPAGSKTAMNGIKGKANALGIIYVFIAIIATTIAPAPAGMP